MGWNVADVWEAVADRFPSSLALVHGDREVTWQPFDERADGVAAALLGAGLSHQDKVAQYLRNGPEYLESMLAAFKAGLVPVNTNYSYADNELRYQLTNSDAAAVVFGAAFTAVGGAPPRVAASVRLWLRVGSTGDDPEWALSYEALAASRPSHRRAGANRRSPSSSRRPGLDEQAVLDHCAGRLARYKQPRKVVFTDTIPRNPTGKILKRLLRDQFAIGAPE